MTPEERKIVARTRKAKICLYSLRERRHELLDTALQDTLHPSHYEIPDLVVKRQWKPGVGPRYTVAGLLQREHNRDAVALTVMDKRWQMVLDCLEAAPPPFSQGSLFNFHMHVLHTNLGQDFVERSRLRWQRRQVALAPGSCGQCWIQSLKRGP